ncbi:MAG: methyltransferase [Niabella sp.]
MKVTTDSCLFGAWVAAQINDLSSGTNILDIGSGSGLLSIMLAQQTHAMIDGIELQGPDYQQSVENISRSAFNNQIKVFNADALHFEYAKQYDIIVSNPPFYENDLKSAATNKNIAHHDAGLYLHELLSLIKRLLQPAGQFFLLLPAKRKEKAEKLVKGQGLFINNIVSVKQTENHPPFRIMIAGSQNAFRAEQEPIIIKEQNKYSHTFNTLLRDYYLQL